MTNSDLVGGRFTRRRPVSALGGGAAALMLGRAHGLALAAPAPSAGALDLAVFQNGGATLGSARDEWIAAFGEGERIDVELGDDLYQYAAQVGMIYVSFREFSDGAFANYVEFAFGGNGLTYDRVEPIVASMMPGDARATGSYLAPATPSGPTAIATWSYRSEELGSLHSGIPSEFLSVRLQQRGEDNAWLVSSALLIAGEIMQ